MKCSIRKWISAWCLAGLALFGGRDATAATAAAWWLNAGVLNTNAPADFAPATLGQAKYFARKACDMMQTNLPGGAGSNVSALVNGFSTSSNSAPVNIGQLKQLARPFYDRLGYSNNYPWTAATGDDRDYAPANIGQVKKLFSFDSDRDSDGLPDWWEIAHGLNPDSGISTSLVAWWKFDEGQGLDVANSANPAYPGRIKGGQTWRKGRSGGPDDYALAFNASARDGVEVRQNPAIVTQAPFSVSFWAINTGWCGNVIADSITVPYTEPWTNPVPWQADTVRGFFVGTGNGNTERFFHFVLGDDWSGDYPYPHSSVHSYDNCGPWTHYVATYDGSNACIYENGRLEERGRTPFRAATNAYLRIGNDYWRGAIDDLRIYNCALPESEVHAFFEADDDPDGDGLNNREEFFFGKDPLVPDNTIYTNRFMSEGAIDITFVPNNWASNSPTRFLAAYGTAGQQGLKLYVTEKDELHFEIWDRSGYCHAISHTWLINNRHLLNNRTNRVVASWKNLNTHRDDAEMRLFVNGIDADLTFVRQMNPKHTRGEWLVGQGYMEASASRIEFPADVFTNDPFNNALCATYGSAATIVSQRVWNVAYGMVADATPPFEVGPKAPRMTTNRCLSIAQCLEDPWLATEAPLSQPRADRVVRQQAQYFDGAEMGISWILYEYPVDNTPYWGILQTNAQLLIDTANTQGFWVARSEGQLAQRLYQLHPELFASSHAMQVSIGSDGIAIWTNSWWEYSQWVMNMVDLADRRAVSNYVALWKQDIGLVTNYPYFLFNETSLQAEYEGYASSTCTTNGLAWFREYTCAQYGQAYAGVKFPVCPINYREWTGGPLPDGWVDTVTLSAALTNLCQITADPDVWAKWWEWRNVVFANLMNGYCTALQELNANNPLWRGVIYFATPGSPWAPVRGVDLRLLAGIRGLTWLVMENSRWSTYGNYCQWKKEVRNQLVAAKSILDTNTGFGSYAMVDSYGEANTNNPDQKLRTRPRPEWLAEDVEFAVSPEFQSEIVVPFSSGMIVYDCDWPHSCWYSAWNQVHHLPEADQAWCQLRFEKLWIPIANLTSRTNGDSSIALSWSWPEQAKRFDLAFSTDPLFATTNAALTCSTNSLAYDPGSNLLPANVPVYWQARGEYEVLYIATNGDIVATNVYPGAWSRSSPSAFTIQP